MPTVCPYRPGAWEEGSSSSTSGCSIITVTGGGIGGEYPYLGVDEHGYDVWGGDERSIGFLASSSLHRLEVAGGKRRDGIVLP